MHLLTPPPHIAKACTDLLRPYAGEKFSERDLLAALRSYGNPFSSVAQEQQRLLTRKEVAERLKVSTRTVDRMIDTGQLEPVRVHKSMRFRPEDVPGAVR